MAEHDGDGVTEEDFEQSVETIEESIASLSEQLGLLSTSVGDDISALAQTVQGLSDAVGDMVSADDLAQAVQGLSDAIDAKADAQELTDALASIALQFNALTSSVNQQLEAVWDELGNGSSTDPLPSFLVMRDGSGNAYANTFSAGNIEISHTPQVRPTDTVFLSLGAGDDKAHKNTKEGLLASLGLSGVTGGGLVVSAAYQAVSGDLIYPNMTGDSFTVEAPENPQDGNSFVVDDFLENLSDTAFVTIDFGDGDTLAMDVAGARVGFLYVNSEWSWKRYG